MSLPLYDERGRGTARGFRHRRRPPRRTFVILLVVLAIIMAGVFVWRVGSGGGPAKAVAPAAGAKQGTPASESAAPKSPAAPKQEKQPEPDATDPAIAGLIDLGLPVYCGAGEKPLVALTFDDGPGPYTSYTIKTLRESHARATFFLVGKLLSSTGRKLANQEAKFGAIGDHTFNHIPLAGASQSTLKHEIVDTRRRIEKAIGEDVFMFRPPLGTRDDALNKFVHKEDMLQIVWSLDTLDATTGTNTDDIIQHIKHGLSAGDIILMHENRGTTRNGLPTILQMVNEAGLKPVTVPQLLAQDPPSRKMVRKGVTAC